MFIHQVYKISNISRLIRLQRVALLDWSRSFWLIFLGQGFLVIFIEFFFKLLPLLEEVQCLNLLPGMPLIEHPVWGYGLPGVNNTAGVVLEDGRVVVLFSPTFPANDGSVQSVLQNVIPTYFSPSSNILAKILISLILRVSSNLARSTTALNLKCHLSIAQLSMVL